MMIARKAGYAPHTVALGREILDLPQYVGCLECDGLCQELMEALTLPDIVVRSSSSGLRSVRVISGGRADA